MFNFLETEVMYKKNYLYMASKILILLVVLVSVIGGTAAAKSLYVLSNIDAYPNPIQVYDIVDNGKLSYNAEYPIPRYNNGSYGLAIDSDSGYLFVTYASWGRIILVNSENMQIVPEMTIVPGAWDLSGIVYNHKKKQLYCVDHGRNYVWVFDWNPQTVKLTLVQGAPFRIKYSSAYGIALDEVDQLLYVTNATKDIHVYSTQTWELQRTLHLNREAICASIDVKNGYLYTGGGYLGNPFLTQYHISSGNLLETLVEPGGEAGVMGVAVDPNSSKVYVTTGNHVIPGGDNIRVFDKYLHPIDVVNTNGNPVGIAVPGKDIGYNPLNLKKSVLKIVNYDGSNDMAADANDLVTYRITLSNEDNSITVSDVVITDYLPNTVTFVSASDDGVFGSYDPITHTYTWLYPTLVTDSVASLDIKVRINSNVPPKTSIINTVTANTNATPEATSDIEIITSSSPLNVKKTIFGAVDGITKWVDVNEVITFNIHVDNNDNDFNVNDVIITDTLPAELVYMQADDDYFGVYDADLHTYTWSIPYLGPDEEIDLDITVRLIDGIVEGTPVTNKVTVQSVETVVSESSIDFRVGQGPLVIKSKDIQVVPGTTLRRDSTLSDIMFIIQMPLGYKQTDVKNTPLVLLPTDEAEAITIQANSDQFVIESGGKTYVIAKFNKTKLMKVITGYGAKNVEITGELADGGLFAAYVTLNIMMFVGN